MLWQPARTSKNFQRNVPQRTIAIIDAEMIDSGFVQNAVEFSGSLEMPV